jgi:hypothetical protein
LTDVPDPPIFSPTFAEHLRQPPPEFLYHYTSQDGLIGIVSSASLWATNINYMNDATEFSRPLGMLRDRLIRHARDCEMEADSFSSTDPVRSAHANQRKERAYELWRHANSIGTLFICVACFCENGDLLSQWRGYAAQGYGYALGFKTAILGERIAPSGFILGRCIYDIELQDKIINEALEYILRSGAPGDKGERFQEFLSVLRYIALFKDTSFVQEQEWRLVPSEPVYLTRTQFRAGKSMIIPYTSIDIGEGKNSPIYHVYVGPCPHMELSKASVSQMLIKHHILNNVGGSSIPFRDW